VRRKREFWEWVDKDSSPDGCWMWTGRDFNKKPHGSYGMWKDLTGKRRLAHRVAYELAVGPIPEGLTLDHLCRVTLCVNPAHLEAVTQGVNTLRGVGPSAVNARRSHCSHGHVFDEANTYVTPDGRRQCRACNRARTDRYYLRKRETVRPALDAAYGTGGEA
jgi:hypothetical protein